MKKKTIVVLIFLVSMFLPPSLIASELGDCLSGAGKSDSAKLACMEGFALDVPVCDCMTVADDVMIDGKNSTAIRACILGRDDLTFNECATAARHIDNDYDADYTLAISCMILFRDVINKDQCLAAAKDIRCSKCSKINMREYCETSDNIADNPGTGEKYNSNVCGDLLGGSGCSTSGVGSSPAGGVSILRILLSIIN